MIYLDYAATTPCSQENMTLYSKLSRDFYYNHESLHAGGDYTKSLREHGENQLDEVFTDDFTTIVTTSASEGNRIAIDLYLQDKPHPSVLVSPLEHPSVFAALERYEAALIMLPILNGTVDFSQVKAVIQDVDLVIMQHTHSETGLLMPVEKMAELCLLHDIPFHCDIVQAAAKLPVNTRGLSSYTFSGHKFYALKGTGALRIRRDYLQPLNTHFHHEYGTKNGTLDIPAFAVMAYGLKEMNSQLDVHLTYVSQLKEQLLAALNTHYTTPDYALSPYIIPLISNQLEGQYIMQRLSQRGILISTGTACGHGIIHSTGLETLLKGSINQYFRVSLSHLTTAEEIAQLAQALNTISEEYHDTIPTTADC